MKMNEYLTALQTQLTTQQSPNQNILDLLYDAYNDTTGMDNEAIKADFERLYQLMNDDLLKQAGGGSYFDELLERIRDIRSSEKVFWRKVLDIYATSVDYSAKAEESVLFFKTVQNKMLYAATGMTEAELVSGRANALLPMMGMTVVKGKRPTLAEAKTAKNYLNEEELGTLNRLVSAYLDLAELQAMRKKPMYMKDWVARLDDYLRMTDSEVLQNAGKVSHALAEQKAKEEYQKYKRLHSGELSRVEQAFLESVEATAKRLEGK